MGILSITKQIFMFIYKYIIRILFNYEMIFLMVDLPNLLIKDIICFTYVYVVWHIVFDCWGHDDIELCKD